MTEKSIRGARLKKFPSYLKNILTKDLFFGKNDFPGFLFSKI